MAQAGVGRSDSRRAADVGRAGRASPHGGDADPSSETSRALAEDVLPRCRWPRRAALAKNLSISRLGFTLDLRFEYTFDELDIDFLHSPQWSGHRS